MLLFLAWVRGPQQVTLPGFDPSSERSRRQPGSGFGSLTTADGGEGREGEREGPIIDRHSFSN